MSYSHFWDKLAGRKRLHSFELVSTKDDGIKYVMVVPTDEVDYVEHSLRSYLPGIKTKEIRDYIAGLDGGTITVGELKLTSDFVLPLQEHTELTEHDPIAYLTGNMQSWQPTNWWPFRLLQRRFNPTHTIESHKEYVGLRVIFRSTRGLKMNCVLYGWGACSGI